jgi:hypothetical protein
MGTPYSRPSTVRTTPLRDGGVVEREYNRVGLALAIFAALCFFCALWAVNGYFTSRTVRSIGLLFHLQGVSWAAGWLVHVVVSLIEHHLHRLREAVSNAPRFVLVGVYCLIVLVGVLDVLTSALAFLLLFSSIGFSATDPTVRFVSVVLAEVIAIIPEPIIVWLCVALWRVVRD